MEKIPFSSDAGANVKHFSTPKKNDANLQKSLEQLRDYLNEQSLLQ